MNSTVHLTDEQIDDYLMGDLREDLSVHLADCGACQGRVAEISDAIQSFKSVTLAWSERQSATMPIRPSALTQKKLGSSRTVWAATAAAAVVISVAVPLAHRRGAPEQHTADAGSTSAQTFTEQREEQIAQDNQMLQAIDREIGAPVNSPSEMFGLELGERSPNSAQSAIVRD